MTKVLYALAADLVTVVHLLFVVFVAAGGLLVLRRPKLARIHLPAVAWGIWVEAAGWICPLTYVEYWLRTAAGEGVFAGGFIERYLLAALYPDGLTRELQFAIAGLVLAVNLLIYSRVWKRQSRLAPGATR